MVGNDNTDYEYILNVPLDICDLELLFEAAFKRKPKPGYFDWKYRMSPDGNVIHCTAWYKGQLVGFYGVLPDTLIIRNERYFCYQSMDTMVHPDHSGKGLFIRLAKLCYEAIDNNADVYAFTGANSTPGFLKYLNFSSNTEIRWVYGFPLLIKLQNCFIKKSNIKISEEFSFDHRFERYLRQRKDMSFVERDLSVEKMNWRIFQNPDKDYSVYYFTKNKEIIGFCVLSSCEKKITTIDYFDFVDRAFFKYIPQLLLKLGNRHNSIYFKCYEASSLRIAYSKYGFIRNPFPRGPFRSTVNFILRRGGLVRKFSELEKGNKLDIQPLMRD